MGGKGKEKEGKERRERTVECVIYNRRMKEEVVRNNPLCLGTTTSNYTYV